MEMKCLIFAMRLPYQDIIKAMNFCSHKNYGMDMWEFWKLLVLKWNLSVLWDWEVLLDNYKGTFTRDATSSATGARYAAARLAARQ